MSPVALGPIADLYRAGRARIEVVNGWRIAAEFDGSAAELRRAREAVGIADLGHLKKVMAVGRGAPAFWEEINRSDTTADSGAVQPGQAWVIRNAQHPLVAGHSALLCACLTDDHIVAIAMDGAVARSGDAPAEPAMHQADRAARDVSGHFAVFELVGPSSADVLRQLTSLDVSDGAFGPGRSAQTGIARVRAILIRPDGGALSRYQIWCAREYGQYLWEVLLETAQPLGGGAMGWRAWQSILPGGST